MHEHTFEAAADATVIRDVVDYTMMMPRLSNLLVVGRDLRAIFEYRHEAVVSALAGWDPA